MRMHELGVLDESCACRTPDRSQGLRLLSERVPAPDFRRLSIHCTFIALMPQ